MSSRYGKLKALLKELFQLDQPDLDFGIYRILHARADEITAFLDKDLLPQIKRELAKYQSADRGALEKEIAAAIEQAQALGVDPEETQKVKELRERLSTEAVDLDQLEAEVYDHLYGFFRRYYSEGDFLSKRVYKEGVYAIPYEGEEVVLHWANKDQYYIKTTEYFRDYAFRLRPENDENPMRVHFRLRDATEGEHGNVREAEGKARVFILAEDKPLSIEEGEAGKELVVFFEYRPATLTDWAAREGQKKPPTQKDLITIAVDRILGEKDKTFAPWIDLLGARHVKTDGETADYSRLEAHLRRYTARNTFDYFIHKDLGGFLRRELDFYIKNEVMHLDDIEHESAPRLEQLLSKIRVIRGIANKIIDFLAQLEDFQKKLWLKKKFVTETSYCIRLGIIPKEFYPEIANNRAQHDEWVELHSIDEFDGDLAIAGYSDPLSVEFLQAHPTLMIDTRHFDEDFTARLLEALGGLDELTDGVLFHSENFQALSLMQARYREQVALIYIDPPYNTGNDGFAYRDRYQHSSWLSMMTDRLHLGRVLQGELGLIAVSIDDVELHRLTEALSLVYGDQELAKLIWDRNRKNDARFFSVGHEYMLVTAKDEATLRESGVRFREPLPGIDEAKAHFRRLISTHRDDWEEIRKGWLDWFSNIPIADPRRRMIRFSKVGPRGPYRDDLDINWPGGGGPRYEVLHPKTGKPCKLPTSGWRFPTPERFWQVVDEGRIVFGPDESTVPSMVSYLFERKGQVMASVHYSYAQTAAQEFNALMGGRVFDNPKNWRDIFRLVRYLTDTGETTLDYFAGSGTTGHAVIEVNREDGASRKFVLVEMGEHFDSVLLPRLKKVVFTPEWENGKPKRLATAEETDRSPRIFKILRLESYEDTLNNLELQRTRAQQVLFDSPEAKSAAGFYESYLLRYMLDVESRGSASLLNIQAFSDPTAYRLLTKRPGSDESRAVRVDLLETFNWLLGLKVSHLGSPERFHVDDFERDAEGRLHIKGRLKSDPDGLFWFRTVEGELPDGRRALVIWRKLSGVPEEDNLVLDEWFRKKAYSSRDSEFDVIYVNGDNNLENLKTPDDLWKVRLIEEDFYRLMFDVETI